MDKYIEEKLQKIVVLYFNGYTVAEAIKKEPFVEGPKVISNNIIT
ncbi:hypothetical protein [Clostridium sp. CF012]|nr:hypothetical protein [Clostridium sp. CF012]